MNVTFLVLFLVTIVTLGYWFIRKRYTYWANRDVIHATPSFPFGNFTGLFKTRHLAHIIQDLYNEFKGKASFAGVYLFLTPAALILDLDLIKHVLIKDFHHFMDRGFYYNEKDDPLSGHLFLLEGEQWRKLRMKLSPTFTSGKMKYMFHTIVDVADHLKAVVCETIKTNPDVDVKDVVARFTTDVIGSCAFGIECNSLKDPNVEFREKGKLIFTVRRNPRVVEVFMTTFQNISRALGLKTTPQEVEDFFIRVVGETVEYRLKNKIVRNDFMQLLLNLKNDANDVEKEKSAGTLTFNEIAAQAFLFFVAGFETSSTLMSFCLHELALNSEIQDKLRFEINTILKKYDGKFTYEAMNEMIYLEMVINETLRMYPALPHLVRKTLKDYRVPDSSQVIEKGTMIFIPVYALQNDPKIYENPTVFNPERFSLDNMKNRHPLSFIPFGEGPRNCIGLRFGKMQTKVGLVTLLSNFKFEKCSITEIPLKLNIKSPLIGVEKHYLRIEKLSYLD